MPQHSAVPASPREPAWDIAVTRLMRIFQPRVESCVQDLARRFRGFGLGSDTHVRQTPRGLSTFLALIGHHGLICIVDMTLVDGMAIGQGPCASLDIRLLDACGDVAAEGLAGSVSGHALESSAAEVLSSEYLERAATAVYVVTLAQFDLLQQVLRRA